MPCWTVRPSRHLPASPPSCSQSALHHPDLTRTECASALRGAPATSPSLHRRYLLHVSASAVLLWAASPVIAAPSPGPTTAAAAPPVPVSDVREEDFGRFILQIPSVLQEIELPKAELPTSTNQTVVESPVQAVFRSPDGACSVTVLSKLASKIKPTLFQLTTISTWGDVQEVADLLLPRGAKLLASSSATIQAPPRDTGSFLGVVTSDPQTVYKYTYVGRDGGIVSVAAGATRGQIIVCGVTVAQGMYQHWKHVVRTVVDEFRVLP